jgi:hypothetical protein
MLIVIGLMIAGLKIAQAMGAGVAGAMANLAGKGSRKLAGGMLKGGAMLTGAVAGVGLAPLLGAWKAATKKGVEHTETWENPFDPTDTETRTTRANATMGARLKAGLGGLFGAPRAIATGAFMPANLYGKATQLLSTGMTRWSGIPIVGDALGAGGQFFGRLSAAQATAVDAAAKETDGLSPAAVKAWIKSASMKDAAHQAAAMALADKNHMHDAIGHDDLKKFADSVASMNPGTERDKIDVLKAFASHDPSHAEDVLGSKANVDRLAEAVRAADTGAVQSWDETVYEKVKKFMSTSQRRAWAGRDGNAQNRVLAEELKGLEGALGELPKNMADDIRSALKKDGHKNQTLMKQVEGHLEKINGNKVLKKAINEIDGATKSLNAALTVARNTNLRTKSKSEHPVHGDVNYTLGALLKRLAGAAFEGGKSGASGGSKPKASSGGDGHGHGH